MSHTSKSFKVITQYIWGFLYIVHLYNVKFTMLSVAWTDQITK